MSSMDDTTAVNGLLRQAINETNQGASRVLLQDQKEYTHAISLLAKALTTCQGIIVGIDESKFDPKSSSNAVLRLVNRCMNESSENSISSDHDSPGSHESSGSPRQRRSHSQPARAAGQSLVQEKVSKKTFGFLQEAAESEDCEADYLYEKLIFVPSAFGQADFTEDFGLINVCMAISCVATFNLACVYHFWARDIMSVVEARSEMRSQQHCAVLLRKAARLYEICITIPQCQGQGQGQGQATANDYETTIFDLAISNNLGVALGQLGKDSAADECYKYVLSVLMFLINNGYRNPMLGRGESIHETALDFGDIDGFFRNVSRIMPDTKPAAAA